MRLHRASGWARSFLGVPLFWKILVANAAVAGFAALLGGAVGERLVAAHQSPAAAVAALAVAGAALSLLLNGVLLRLALEPIERLEEVAARVQRGELDARAPESPVADRSLARLTRTFNAALDALAQSRGRVRRLLERSVEVEEAERRAVAHALENDAAQRLAHLLVRLSLARRDAGSDAVTGLITEARDEIARAAEIVRGYAAGRRPAVLEHLGLAAGLEAEARRWMATDGVVVRIDAPAQGLRLSPAGALSIYRIVQEALEDAVRHAGAREVRVLLALHEPGLVVTVEDDGTRRENGGPGHEPPGAPVNGPAGLGLLAIQERAALTGGRVSLTAGARGRTLRIELPLVSPAVPMAAAGRSRA